MAVVTAEPSLAELHLHRLGVPTKLDQPYDKEDASRVLRGQSVAPAIRDTIHAKLAWIVGVQVVGHVNRTFPDLGWTHDRVAVRTLVHGEASASFMTFADHSHAILVSRALQENLICMANVVEYFDISTGLARLSLRRRKREREQFECAARVTAILRYLLLGQRMTGVAPSVPAELDERSFDIAGKMAAGALMFVVAHEIAHVAHGHETMALTPYGDGPVTVSEIQELQADIWALNFLKELMADDPAPENIALWCAFIALVAMHVTEQAIYVRRNRTHPEAWSRWAMLEKSAVKADDRTERMRLGLLAAVMGASKLDECFPEDVWPLLWEDRMLSVAAPITEDVLIGWDHLHAAPVAELVAQLLPAATDEGLRVLDALRSGDVGTALACAGVSPRRRNRVLDPSEALGFSTLRELFYEPRAPLTDGDRTARLSEVS